MSGRRAGAQPRPTMWEYRTVTISRTLNRGDYRRALTEEAERGQWELRRVLVFPDGTRRVTLRRRAVPVEVTLAPR